RSRCSRQSIEILLRRSLRVRFGGCFPCPSPKVKTELNAQFTSLFFNFDPTKVGGACRNQPSLRTPSHGVPSGQSELIMFSMRPGRNGDEHQIGRASCRERV